MFRRVKSDGAMSDCVMSVLFEARWFLGGALLCAVSSLHLVLTVEIASTANIAYNTCLVLMLACSAAPLPTVSEAQPSQSELQTISQVPGKAGSPQQRS